jgi:hypothetical protein
MPLCSSKALWQEELTPENIEGLSLARFLLLGLRENEGTLKDE